MAQKSFSRSDRISDLIHQEIAKIVRLESKDPRFKTINISAVKLTPDRKLVTVYFNAFDEEDTQELEKPLNKAAGFFRTRLAKNAELKYTPQIRFKYDITRVKASNLSDLINNLDDDQS